VSTPAAEPPPRLLAIMGSGETAPTMVKVHRGLLERLGPPPVRAVMLDTPFGFQENAREIAGRAVAYFRESLQATIEVTGLTAGDDASFAPERLVSTVRDARYVFAGPGSPTYALRQWRDSVVPELLAEKLRHGGCVVFASAAALTLGVATVPVYEIYKCGEDPRWENGLGLASIAGLEVAVVPHYDNNEGGTHDTRFCYLGERRLAAMERELPDGAFVLGIDEHTSVVLDIGAGTATVGGRGVLTVRAGGRSRTFPAGTEVGIPALAECAAELWAVGSGRAGGGSYEDNAGEYGDEAATPSWDRAEATARSTSPLVDVVRSREGAFAEALARRDVRAAVQEVLELEREITAWSSDIPPGDELDRAHASLRSLVVELGRLSETGSRDPREVLGPFVEALLDLRVEARAARRYAEADAVRDRLVGLGIEVRDTADGAEWLIAPPQLPL